MSLRIRRLQGRRSLDEVSEGLACALLTKIPQRDPEHCFGKSRELSVCPRICHPIRIHSKFERIRHQPKLETKSTLLSVICQQ
ncbi:unnamed protein product, partial [Citrullus colocynthis]